MIIPRFTSLSVHDDQAHAFWAPTRSRGRWPKLQPNSRWRCLKWLLDLIYLPYRIFYLSRCQCNACTVRFAMRTVLCSLQNHHKCLVCTSNSQETALHNLCRLLKCCKICLWNRPRCCLYKQLHLSKSIFGPFWPLKWRFQAGIKAHMHNRVVAASYCGWCTLAAPVQQNTLPDQCLNCQSDASAHLPPAHLGYNGTEAAPPWAGRYSQPGSYQYPGRTVQRQHSESTFSHPCHTHNQHRHHQADSAQHSRIHYLRPTGRPYPRP